MVIVTTADPFCGQHDGGSWKHEKATINLVADFIASLPEGQAASSCYCWPRLSWELLRG